MFHEYKFQAGDPPPPPVFFSALPLRPLNTTGTLDVVFNCNNWLILERKVSETTTQAEIVELTERGLGNGQKHRLEGSSSLRTRDACTR
jgi:hypothetical protein